MSGRTTPVCLVAVLGMLLSSGSSRVGAATLTVTNTSDSGAGSLRAALASATNGDTIDATSVSGTITLSSGELLITNDLSIKGPGADKLTINGNYPNSTNRVFHVAKDATVGVTVSISGLIITNGNSSEGAGIFNLQSALTLSNCIVSGNSATYNGGGIFNVSGPSGNARLTVVNSTLSGNSAIVGAGIYNDGEPGSAILNIVGSTITSNTAGDVGGGGINNDGSPTGSAMVFITNSTLSGNSTIGNGGGIRNDGFQGNAAVTLVNSTLSGNSADSGGGIFNNDGGSGGYGKLVLINATLSGNSTTSRGGGICNGFFGGGTTTLMLTSVTLSDNLAPAVGGIYNIGTLQIGNTLLNAGSSGSNISSFAGIVISLGYNLSSDNAAGFLTNVSDQVNINPVLGPLQDNGGPVFTQALLEGSPAIDKGKNLSGETTDARDLPRVFDDPAIANAASGDGTDIGAYEVFELRITAVEKLGNDLRLSFNSRPAVSYELQSRSNLVLGVWSSVPGSFPGNGSTAQATVTNAFGQAQQFYRIYQLP